MATDKKNALKELIEMGKSKGRLTGKEILDALEDLDFDPEQMDKLYDSIESQNIEIVEDFADDEFEDLDIVLDGADEESDVGTTSDVIAIDDPVKVYLKEVHEEKSYTTEWFKQFSDKEFVKVTATWISFGEEYKKTIVLNTKLWKQIKEQGYYLG